MIVLGVYNYGHITMYPIEFLYWIYGAIKLGNLNQIVAGSQTSLIITDHVKLVADYKRLCLELSKDHSPKELEMFEYITLIGQRCESGTVNGTMILEIVTKIQNLIFGNYHEKQNLLLYFLQGAFELTDYNQIKITKEIINSVVDGRYKKELLFYFILTEDQYLTGKALENLKSRVDRALRTAC